MMMLRTSVLILGSMTMLAGCRSAGLPPVAPEHDASNPEVGIVEAGAPLHPLTRSAFEGEALEEGGGHEHHHQHGGHGGHGKAAEPAAEAEPSEHEGHEGHGGRS